METESDHILVFFSNNKYLLWNLKDIRCLRSKYRIVGSLVGCLPGQSYQNSQLGLPLQLMPEEVSILRENNVCKLIDFCEKRYESGDTEIGMQFEDCTTKSLKEYKNLLRDERIEQMKRRCEEITAGKKKRLKDSNDKIVSHEFVDEEIKRIPELTVDQFPIQLYTRCPMYNLSTDKLFTYFKDINLQMNYPKNDCEILKYTVFKDLWSKGYFVTNGFKFGCDYLVYEGDPCICHAKYMIVCISDDNLSPLSFHILGRLSVQVNKQVLIASIDTGCNVIYKSLNSDTLRNSFRFCDK